MILMMDAYLMNTGMNKMRSTMWADRQTEISKFMKGAGREPSPFANIHFFDRSEFTHLCSKESMPCDQLVHYVIHIV